VDSQLGEEQRGEVLSEQIADLGFDRIVLTTGYDPSDQQARYPWLQGVIDKNFPMGVH